LSPREKKKKKKNKKGVLFLSFVLTVNTYQTPAQVNTAQALADSPAFLFPWIYQLMTDLFHS